jgi:hypothetical protein
LLAQVFPSCGDGVNVAVTMQPSAVAAAAAADGRAPQPRMLHEAEYAVSSQPTRQRLHFYLDAIATGDVIDLTVLPGSQHDCDGALILDLQLWDQESYRGS